MLSEWLKHSDLSDPTRYALTSIRPTATSSLAARHQRHTRAFRRDEFRRRIGQISQHLPAGRRVGIERPVRRFIA